MLIFLGHSTMQRVAAGAQPDGEAAKDFLLESFTRKVHQPPRGVVHVQRERATAAAQAALQAMPDALAADRVADPAANSGSRSASNFTMRLTCIRPPVPLPRLEAATHNTSHPAVEARRRYLPRGVFQRELQFVVHTDRSPQRTPDWALRERRIDRFLPGGMVGLGNPPFYVQMNGGDRPAGFQVFQLDVRLGLHLLRHNTSEGQFLRHHRHDVQEATAAASISQGLVQGTSPVAVEPKV